MGVLEKPALPQQEPLGGLDLVVGLLENGDLMGKVAETARLYWTNSALTVNVFSNLFNGTLLVLAGLLFIYVFDLLANSEHGYGFLQKKSYDVAVEEAAYTLGAILELQQQVAELQEHTFGKSREAPAVEGSLPITIINIVADTAP